MMAFLLDLGLVNEEVDLAETGARGEAEVFEDIAIRVGSMRKWKSEGMVLWERKVGKLEERNPVLLFI